MPRSRSRSLLSRINSPVCFELSRRMCPAQDHLVYERRLAVIDVGDDRNVAQFLHRYVFCRAKVRISREISLFLLVS